MTTKKIIAALISTAIAVPLCTTPVLADEPPAVGFDDAGDTAVEGFGDITDETASGSENDPDELYHNSVDMGSDDETEEGDALLFDNQSGYLVDINENENGGSGTSSGDDTSITTEPDNEFLPKHKKLVNGSFQYPEIPNEWINDSTRTLSRIPHSGRWFRNTYEKFEEFTKEQDPTREFGWRSTSRRTDQIIGEVELVANHTYKYDGSYRTYSRQYSKKIIENNQKAGEPKSDDDGQFAELVPNDQSSIYQNLRTFSGEKLDWSLSHRARQDSTKYVDTMALIIGPSYSNTNQRYEDITYAKPGKTDIGSTDAPQLFLNNNVSKPKFDMFMWIGELISEANSGGTKLFPVTNSERADPSFTNFANKNSFILAAGNDQPDTNIVYVNPSVNEHLSSITRDSSSAYYYKNYYSLTYVEGWQTWHCWIITDDGDWRSYRGSYEVPAGQEATTFAFTALSGDNNSTEGNNLDKVVFNMKHPLDVTATAGGSGNVTYTGTNNYVVSNVDYSNPYNQNRSIVFPDETKVTVTATPDSDHVFLGLYENGVFYDAATLTSSGSGSYSKEVTINEAKTIHLMFAGTYSVMYDPNGGTFNNTSDTTTVRMSANGGTISGGTTTYSILDSNYTVDAVPAQPHVTDGRVLFTGWYVARAGSSGRRIKGGHTIEYVKAADLDTKLHEIDTSPGSYTSEDKFLLKFALADSQSDEYEYYACLPAANGLTLVAQWKYLQECYAMTKVRDAVTYSQSETGGTVTCSITDPQNAPRNDGGFGRNGDTVLLTAEAKPGFLFMGWYDSPNGGELLGSGSAYSYSVYEPRRVYARFSEEWQFPYLSFVSEGAVSLDPTLNYGTHQGDFASGSHVKAGDNEYLDSLIGVGGNDKYGNTVSTGFIVNTNNVSSFSIQYIKWVINLRRNDTHDMYVKIPDGSFWDETVINANPGSNSESEDTDASIIGFDQNPIFTDSNDVLYNKGSIYRVNYLYNDDIQFVFTDALPQTSNAALTFGLVLDNIYAPGAGMTLEYLSDKPETGIDLTGDDASVGSIRSKSFAEYLSNSGYGN